jgi:hypothetical protein
VRYTVVIVGFLALFIAGCGIYTFNPKGKSNIRSVAVLPFENTTGQLQLTDRLTEIIVDAFIADGSLKVVSEANADVALQGVLDRYERLPHIFDENDQVQQYKVVMGFEISLSEPGSESAMWTQRLNQEGPYDAETETEEDGQRRAGERLVQAIIDKTTKSW